MKIESEELKRKYISNLNAAYRAANVTEQYMTIAEDLLMITENYKLLQKKLTKSIRRDLAQLTEFADKALKTGEKQFYDDVTFLKDIIDNTLMFVTDKEKADKVITFIQSLKKEANE